MFATLLFELIYTIWPYLLWLVTGPFWILSLGYMAIELISRFAYPWITESSLSMIFLLQLSFIFVLAAGALFIEQLGLKLRNSLRHKKIDISRKAWFRLWFVQASFFMIIWLIGSNLPIHYDLIADNQMVGLLFIFLFVFSYGAVFWYGLIFLGEVAFKLLKLKQRIPSKFHPWLAAAPAILAVYPFLVAVTILGWVLIEDSPQSTRFAVVHAAIKNTCLIDPNKENCPQTLVEISYIEPQKYQEMIDCCQVYYQYQPKTNQYTLVIRYTPTQAVIFDQRLVEETGLDFRETQLSLLGTDRIINPPTWDGPWIFPDWSYPNLL